MIDIVKKQILPSCIEYIEKIAKTITTLNSIIPQLNTKAESSILKELSFNVNNLKTSLDNLEEKLYFVEKENDVEKKSILFRDNLVPLMKKVRENVDTLEMLVAKDYWPLPSYGDLIFEVSSL